MFRQKLQDLWPLLLFPALKAGIHLATSTGYGTFRDEFYYVACSRRLAFGYVDHPALSIALLRGTLEVLGESLWAIRLVPTLAGALAVFVVGLLARRMGGGAVAQCLAMASALVVPGYLALHHFYSMNALDILFWAVTALLVIELAENEGDLRRWALLGVVLGLGLHNKISILWLGLGLGVGILLTDIRRTLKTPGPWLAGGLAFLLFLPHLLWQVHNGWPTLEFIANATGQKMVEVQPLEFLAGQFFFLGGPAVAGLALLGLGALFMWPALARFRWLAWIYVTVFVVLAASGTSRAGYLAPAYTWLLAAGAVALERFLPPPPKRGWLLALVFGLLATQGALLAPLGLPLLPVDGYIAHAQRLGIAPSTAERKELAELPQFFADMHGWPEKVAGAQEAVRSLSPQEQEEACVFAYNYGVAGALEVLGGEHMPPVVSGHNNYYLWGPGNCTGEVLVIMGGTAEGHRRLFASVEEVTRVDCGYCMPYENHQGVFVARGLQGDLEQVWQELKHYD